MKYWVFIAILCVPIQIIFAVMIKKQVINIKEPKYN